MTKLLLVCALIGLATPIHAGVNEWQVNGTPVADRASNEIYPTAISDGAGGAIIVWDTGGGLFAQRMSATGARLWGDAGVSIGEAGVAIETRIVSDGTGGAYVAWFAEPDRVRAQRITSSGSVSPGWPGEGLFIGTGQSPRICWDGVDGPIVCWGGGGFPYTIYALKLTSSGIVAPGWPAVGVALSAIPNADMGASNSNLVVSDNAGGAIAAWEGGAIYEVRGSPLRACYSGTQLERILVLAALVT